MRNCIKATTPEAKNAAKECKEERAADPDAFAETYGTNGNHRNALGKCMPRSWRTTKRLPNRIEGTLGGPASPALRGWPG